MDLRQWINFCGLVFLGPSLHAASFDCKKASSKTEKIICGNDALSDLDSKLHETYQQAYAASPSNQARLLRGQRDWIKYVRDSCDDERCLTITYDVRIDQLASLARSNAGDDQQARLKVLTFKGIQLGQPLDDKLAHDDFQRFSCNDWKMDKELSSIEHVSVVLCRGTVIFERQPMDAMIELHAGHRVASIDLTYDTPYPVEGVNSTSVSEMENRLIAAYGQPVILRTESTHQLVQYDPKDLLPSSNATDEGADQWAFANGASIVMDSAAGYQKEEGGHIFSREMISFNSGMTFASITLPAQHPVPVILVKVMLKSENDPLWKPDELMTVHLYPGGTRTCKIGALSPPRADNRGSNYTTTIVCTDFIVLSDSVTSPPPTIVSVVRDGDELAVGYIPVSTAVANIEHR